MTSIKEFNLSDVRKNYIILNRLNRVYKLWGYEEISPSIINNIETIKAREVINEDELVALVSGASLYLRPEMTTSIVKLTSTRLINKKRPIRLWNNGIIFEKKKTYKNLSKLKEKLQSGIELIGYDSKFPEIEVINILFDAISKNELKENCKLTLLVSSTTIMDIILSKYAENNYEDIKTSMINLDQDSLNKLDINKEDKRILNELIFTRGTPLKVIEKLRTIYGSNNILNDLSDLFENLKPISDEYNIDIQLDPTFQPHLNLYAGIVFQLVCQNGSEKIVVAKGGRYDELVKFFSPQEKIFNGLGFSISIDNLRNLINEENPNNKKVLLLYKNKNNFQKALNIQRELHNNGTIAIFDINPCKNDQSAALLMKKNNCTEFFWID